MAFSSSPSVLDAYTNGISPDAKLLGRLTWFWVHDTTIRHDDLLARMDTAGVDRRFAPSPPADVDVFRRITHKAASKRNPNADGTYSNVLVRDVSNDEFQVLRRLVVETVDGNNRRLSYLEAYDLAYDKTTSQLVTKKRSWEATVADNIVAGIVADYNAHRGTVNGEALRTMIGRVFDASHSTSLRPTGGLNFTPITEAHLVDGLKVLARLIPKMNVRSCDLVDQDGEQLDNVRDAYADESEKDIDLMMAEAKAILTDKGSARRKATLLSRVKQERAKAVAYSDLLDDKLSTVLTRLEMFDSQMMAVLDKDTE